MEANDELHVAEVVEQAGWMAVADAAASPEDVLAHQRRQYSRRRFHGL